MLIDRGAVQAPRRRGGASNVYPAPFLAGTRKIESGADERRIQQRFEDAALLGRLA
jgi:hypothetical protein